MPNPRDYFTDRAERLIAETAWAVAAKPALDAWTPVAYMSFWKWAPHTHNQIVLARAWTTEKRETPNPDTGNKDGGVSAMQASIQMVLGIKDVTVRAANVANVEHFYSSALITTVGGVAAGPVMAGAASVIWDMALGPYLLVAVHTWKTDLSQQGALDTVKIISAKVAKGLTNNYNQVTGPDQRGVQFALALGLTGRSTTQTAKEIIADYYRAGNSSPPSLAPGSPRVTGRRYKVKGGDTLSGLAKWFYQGELWRWPVLYARNRSVIGSNYNLIREGYEISVPLPWEMTLEELATARVKHQQWNKEGRW